MDPEELLKQIQEALDEGLLVHLYRLASVSPEATLRQLRDQGIEVYSLGELGRVPAPLLDAVADDIISRCRRRGALTGAGLSVGGYFTLAPEIIWYLSTLLRLGQRLAMVYGQEVQTLKGQIELWQALASALGVQVDLEGLDGELHRGLPMAIGRGTLRDPILLNVVQQVLIKLSMALAKRITRFVPVLNIGLGGLATYRQLSNVGEQLKETFRTRHQLRTLSLSDLELSEEISFQLDPVPPRT